MPDYCLFQKDQSLKAINVTRLDKQDALTVSGYARVWEVIHADNADAALLRYQQLCHEEDQAPQAFATDSVFGSLMAMLSR